MKIFRQVGKETLAMLGRHAGLSERSRYRTPGAVRILTYHRFRMGERRDSTACLSVRRFREHLDHVSRAYEVIPLADAVRLVCGQRKEIQTTSRPPISITIDDGFEDSYLLAFPELRMRAIPATIFVVSSFVASGEPPWPSELTAIIESVSTLRLADGRDVCVASELEREVAIRNLFRILESRGAVERRSFLADLRRRNGVEHVRGELRPVTRTQLREMSAAGVEVGSHSTHHTVLTKAPPGEARTEIEASREAVGDMSGRPCRFFAYPDGKWTPAVASMLDSAGYEGAVTQDWGLNVAPVNRFSLNRIEVPYFESARIFEARVSGILRPRGHRRFGEPGYRGISAAQAGS